MPLNIDTTTEWLETDGLGGFASGTTSGIRTRRYHGLLLVATTPPTGRALLVSGYDAWVETPAGRFPISSQYYAPDVMHPDSRSRIEKFETEPWPRWTFRLEDGTCIEQELMVRHGIPGVALSWRLRGRRQGVTLVVRPLFSCRDYHALHHENPAFRFDATLNGERMSWSPYPSLPGIVACTNAVYTHQPDWYRNFLYGEEQARGLDATEDLASPGMFQWNLSLGKAILLLTAEGQETAMFPLDDSAATCLNRLRSAEQRRRKRFPSPLERAADAYLVQRGEGKTIVAGYPWFADWGRDTFIAMRGLCIATGRLSEARDILLEWAGAVSEGMMPNRFPDTGNMPEYNSVDASLWYVIAVYDYLQAMAARQQQVEGDEQQRLQTAVEAILAGYAQGTRHGIHLDADGLIAAGDQGVQLTWMDAKVGDWVVTPRIGKPVEIEALWLNALWIGSTFSSHWGDLFSRARETFRTHFWNENGGYLYDVIDLDHESGTADATFRPNQIFAVGGLPVMLLEAQQAKAVVEAVEARLWTPMGLRSLAPGEPNYTPRYEGGMRERDGAYHQGTIWPWLLGPFVEAWLRVQDDMPEAKKTAQVRYLDPLLEHLSEAGLGHISEIADSESPHTPRGCPFQAWSLGELLRLYQVVCATRATEMKAH